MRLTLAAGLLCVVSGSLGAAPPVAAVKVVTDTYHGVTVEDPYRWLENWDDPAAQSWSAGQNIHARSVLDGLPHVGQIRARVTAIMNARSAGYGELEFAGGKMFALKRQPPKQQPFIVVMDSPLHPEAERVLVDPNVLNTKGTTAIDWFVVSPDGKLVAVSLSEGGSEAGDLHVFEVATGRQVHEVIPHVQNGTGGGAVGWMPDSKSFFYTRYPQGTERPVEDQGFYMQLFHHTLGTPVAQDRYEIGKDFPKIAEVIVDVARDGVALVSMQKGDGGEFQHYARTLDGQWHQLTRYEDRVVQAGFGRGEAGSGVTPIYFLSLKDAPHGQLLRLALKSKAGEATVADAKVVVAQGKETLVQDFSLGAASIAVTDSRIYAIYQLGGPSEVRVFDLAGKALPTPKQFAVGAATAVVASAESGDDVLIYATSYIDPRTWFSYEAKTGGMTKTPLSQKSPVDFADCEVVREWATSKDGTQVPVNIIRKKGLKLDGSHPCVLTGYGGYGVNIDPAFSPARRVLLEQGVVFAEANIRGGGEFGDEWHRQGNLTKKQNVFDDFAAAAGYLVKAGYTKPEKLALEGGSNGGLLMGATFTQHPELAHCVVSHVGIYDMLRVELSANGAFNIPEFGTVKDEAQFKALAAYSPYQHVKAGVHYPAIFFLTGANDPRVDPMQSRKMTARLQAAGADVLLRTSTDSGHGMGSSLQQRIDETVDVDAYLFKQLGIEYRVVEN